MPTSGQPHGLSLSRAEKEEEEATYFTSIHNIVQRFASRMEYASHDQSVTNALGDEAEVFPLVAGVRRIPLGFAISFRQLSPLE